MTFVWHWIFCFTTFPPCKYQLAPPENLKSHPTEQLYHPYSLWLFLFLKIYSRSAFFSSPLTSLPDTHLLYLQSGYSQTIWLANHQSPSCKVASLYSWIFVSWNSVCFTTPVASKDPPKKNLNGNINSEPLLCLARMSAPLKDNMRAWWWWYNPGRRANPPRGAIITSSTGRASSVVDWAWKRQRGLLYLKACVSLR